MYNAGLTHFLCHFLELSYPALTLFIANDLNIPIEKIITVGFPLYLFLGIFAVPWGIISDRNGPYFALGAACLLTALGSIGMFFSSSLSLISPSLCLIGLGIAAFHPAGMAAISSTYSERRGRALAVHGMWGGVGILSAPAISALIAYYINWQAFYLLAALFSLLVAIWSFRIQKDFGLLEGSTGSKNEPAKISSFFTAMIKTFKYREFFLLLICMSLAGIVYRSNTIALPVLLKENSGDVLTNLASFIQNYFPSKESSNLLNTGSSLLMGLAIAGGLIGQKVAGGLADKYDLTKCYFYYFLLAIPSLALIGILSGSSLVLITFIYFFFGLGMQPIENSLVAELSPKEILSSIYGLKFLFAFGLAAIVVYPVGMAVSSSMFTQLYFVLGSLLLVHIFIVSRMKSWKS